MSLYYTMMHQAAPFECIPVLRLALENLALRQQIAVYKSRGRSALGKRTSGSPRNQGGCLFGQSAVSANIWFMNCSTEATSSRGTERVYQSAGGYTAT